MSISLFISLRCVFRLLFRSLPFLSRNTFADENNKERIHSSGALRPLINMFGSSNPELLLNVLVMLSNCAENGVFFRSRLCVMHLCLLLCVWFHMYVLHSSIFTSLFSSLASWVYYCAARNKEDIRKLGGIRCMVNMLTSPVQELQVSCLLSLSVCLFLARSLSLSLCRRSYYLLFSR